MTPDDDPTTDAGLAPHSFFVPMVDLLAGVVFLLVIMLAASVLVTRPDFGEAQAMQSELRRIAAELEAARTSERLLLDPRRQADRDRRLLLERLAVRIGGSGYGVVADPKAGTLAIAQGGLFGPGAVALTPAGSRLAHVVAEALAQEIPCLGPQAPAAGDCAAYGGARLETAMIMASPPPAAPNDELRDGRARSLRFLSEVAAARPMLLDLAGEDAVPIVTYGETGTGLAAAGEGLFLQFGMRLPPIP